MDYNLNHTEKRTLSLWYLGLAFGAVAVSISLYSLYLYKKDLENKYAGSETRTLPISR